jgi:hypothetical protein
MNPLSQMGSGANGLPVTQIIYGVIILAVLVIIWILWRRKIKGKKISFRKK